MENKKKLFHFNIPAKLNDWRNAKAKEDELPKSTVIVILLTKAMRDEENAAKL
ncbi:hypothetical protein AGMMS49975_29750 [Clostridia bacterium]|nr:hypothetical protein AGMMS49975_29750 [Clostridia bacterium]